MGYMDHVMPRSVLGTVSLWGEPFEEICRQAAEAGYDALELISVIGVESHPQPGEADTGAIADVARAHGLEIVSVHAGGIDGGSDAGLERQVKHIEGCCEMAAGLGARLIVFTGFDRLPQTPPAERQERCDRIARGLRAIHPALETQDLYLGLENHYCNEVEDLGDYRRILGALEGCPRIGVTLDTGHCTSSGIDLIEIADALWDRVLHIHIKDHIGTRSVPFGHGETDNAALADWLGAHEYRGLLAAELELEGDDAALRPRYVKESYGYMADLIRRMEQGSVS